MDAALVCQTPAHGVGNKRGRDDGSLMCGDIVSLSAGTVVALEPALGYGMSRQRQLSADECQLIGWVFSGVEPGE